MGLRINTNMAALIGQRNVERTDRALGKALERLSSGLRLNRAADDPAGLVVAERQRAQIAGLNQAVENVERATSLVQTAEAALAEVNSILIHMRELTIDSANLGVHDATSIAANQAEIDNALDTIDRIARDTSFGQKKLLDGSAANSVTFADGTNTTMYATFSSSTLDTGTYALELSSVTDASWAAENTTTRDAMGITGNLSADAQDVKGLAAGSHVVKVTQASTAANVEGTVTLADYTGANETFQLIVKNAAGGTVTAAADLTIDANWTDTTVAVADLNGAIEGDANIGLMGDNVAKVEAYVVDATTIGFRATAEGSGSYVEMEAPGAGATALGSALLGFADGDSSDGGGTATGTQGVDAIVELDSYATTVTYVEGDDTETATVVTLTDSEVGQLKLQVDNSTQIESYTERGLVVGNIVVDVTAATGSALLRDSEYGGGGTAGSSVTWTADTAFTIAAYGTAGSMNVTIGNQILLDGAGAGTAYEDLTVVDNSLQFQVGGDRLQTVDLSLPDLGSDTLAQNVTNTTNFANLSEVTVSTAQQCADAILLIDQAISEVTNARGDIGSFQSNTLESQLNNLQVAAENMTAARSTIMDANFAEEVSEFTKAQILMQSGMTILANAGTMPQMILSLLR